jgi:hypothetical protein
VSFETSLRLSVVVVSELLALWIIWRLWRSADHPFLKTALSLLALIPVLGPIIALWIGHFPTSKPPILRDQARYRADFYDRWRSVLSEQNPVRRFRRWRTLMTRHRNEDP